MEFDSLVMGSGNAVYASKPADTMPAAPTTGEYDKFAATPGVLPKTKEAKKPDAVKKAERNPAKEPNISEEDIQKTIDTANKKIEPLFLEFQHKIHTKTNMLMIFVINKATNEVVREIPPEKTLDALAKMWELAGILVDKKG